MQPHHYGRLPALFALSFVLIAMVGTFPKFVEELTELIGGSRFMGTAYAIVVDLTFYSALGADIIARRRNIRNVKGWANFAMIASLGFRFLLVCRSTLMGN